MKVAIQFDPENSHPVVCFEAETRDEQMQLDLLDSFETVGFQWDKDVEPIADC